MKKLILIILLIVASFKLYALSFTPSFVCESTDYTNAVYMELALEHSFEQVQFRGAYSIGYDALTANAYNYIYIDVSLILDWGSIQLHNELSSAIGYSTKLSVILGDK